MLGQPWWRKARFRASIAALIAVAVVAVVAAVGAVVALTRLVPVPIAVELIRVLPTAIWAAVAVAVVLIFRGSITRDLIPRVAGIKAFGLVEASFVRRELDQAAKDLPDVAGTEEGRSQVSRRAARLAPILRGTRVLLVNDVPAQMRHVVAILRGLGMDVDIVTTTDAAMHNLSQHNYDLVVSDMRRGDVEDDGIRLIRAAQERGVYRPTILTVGRYQPDKGVPPSAFGITNQLDELLNLIFDVAERRRG